MNDWKEFRITKTKAITECMKLVKEGDENILRYFLDQELCGKGISGYSILVDDDEENDDDIFEKDKE